MRIFFFLKYRESEEKIIKMKGQKIVIILIISALSLLINECESSSIPMFEFLTRDEKVRIIKSQFKMCHIHDKMQTKVMRVKNFNNLILMKKVHKKEQM